MKLAVEHGFHSVKIGHRILRTETAALAALSLMQYIQGDFSFV
ncbi:MAG: 16S rRNA (uracil(1498)-N(3))-methyltransferase [Gammaproteobacteria bacterium]|nr:16S rRNA (uracil(1498)-N(3))-methyltransferase [Gammaproteobacteria bacterium]